MHLRIVSVTKLLLEMPVTYVPSKRMISSVGH